MDEQLERYEDPEEDSLSHPRGVSQQSPCLLLDPCELHGKRAVEMWTGFLYGQELWTLRDKDSLAEDFDALKQVLNFALSYKHYFAQDAAHDAIRVILRDYIDVLGDPLSMLIEIYPGRTRFEKLIIMLMDFVIYGKTSEKVKLWTDTADPGNDRDMLELKERMSSGYFLKTEVERTGDGRPGGPDLMFPCRYHWHFYQGGPCYLGGDSAGTVDASDV